MLKMEVCSHICLFVFNALVCKFEGRWINWDNSYSQVIDPKNAKNVPRFSWVCIIPEIWMAILCTEMWQNMFGKNAKKIFYVTVAQRHAIALEITRPEFNSRLLNFLINGGLVRRLISLRWIKLCVAKGVS